jgi:hypothetical protein
MELHQPLGAAPLEYQGAAVPKRMNKLGSAEFKALTALRQR